MNDIFASKEEEEECWKLMLKVFELNKEKEALIRKLGTLRFGSLEAFEDARKHAFGREVGELLSEEERLFREGDDIRELREIRRRLKELEKTGKKRGYF